MKSSIVRNPLFFLFFIGLISFEALSADGGGEEAPPASAPVKEATEIDVTSLQALYTSAAGKRSKVNASIAALNGAKSDAETRHAAVANLEKLYETTLDGVRLLTGYTATPRLRVKKAFFSECNAYYDRLSSQLEAFLKRADLKEGVAMKVGVYIARINQRRAFVSEFLDLVSTNDDFERSMLWGTHSYHTPKPGKPIGLLFVLPEEMDWASKLATLLSDLRSDLLAQNVKVDEGAQYGPYDEGSVAALRNKIE
ncbi:MAG: hypothetical protein H6925_00005, partial [Holosporaceae bacterium]